MAFCQAPVFCSPDRLRSCGTIKSTCGGLIRLKGGEVAVVRAKARRFRVTISKDLVLALGLEGGERGRFRLLRLSSTQVVLSLEITRKGTKGG